MSIPHFADIGKSANDLLNKEFYHASAGIIDVKSKAPNNVSFQVKGKSSHEGATSGSIEAKYKDEPTGLVLTQTWTTTNSLDTKVELENVAGTKGLKFELLTNYLPASKEYGAKTNLHFKQGMLHSRALFDLFKGPTATVDTVISRDGFLVGAEAGYDVNKAAITKYSAAIGYTAPEWSGAITAISNLSVFSASYYHKVNSQVEAGAKAVWDSKASSTVGLEVASKYRIDPSSFAKAKINDRGIAALAYQVLLRPGVKVGFGASFDTQKLNESSHKVGVSFEFEA